jgi:hypothetical protein
MPILQGHSTLAVPTRLFIDSLSLSFVAEVIKLNAAKINGSLSMNIYSRIRINDIAIVKYGLELLLHKQSNMIINCDELFLTFD